MVHLLRQRRERVVLAYPSGSARRRLATSFKPISKTAVSLISSKTNHLWVKNVKAYSRVSLKIHGDAAERMSLCFSTVNRFMCMFLWFFSCLSVSRVLEDPNSALRPDTLLHKPLVLCCLRKSRLHGLLMPVQSE